MPRYVAFLRGVSPQNARMPDLVRAFEAAGFRSVRTVLGTGNVVFDSRAAVATLERRAEAAMRAELGRTFATFVRGVAMLRDLLDADPYAGLALADDAKRVVTFLRAAPVPAPRLPVERDGASILRIAGTEAFSAYVPGEKGPVFMALLEATFGKDITTRTLDTVRRCAAA
ncbi:MAG: DUF1697 domain-containing protein [Thermoleophilia bacterium]|nr:DUF1697 domain-containing protein [Thermoleophilia bacterium]